MDAFGVLDEVLDDYQAFVEGFLNTQDEQVKAKVDAEIEDGLLWPEPWLALNPAFESGGTVGQFVERGDRSPFGSGTGRSRGPQAFHSHQAGTEAK